MKTYPKKRLEDAQTLPTSVEMLKQAQRMLRDKEALMGFHSHDHQVFGRTEDLDAKEAVRLMMYPNDQSVMVASNLRRSISTLMIALCPRLANPANHESIKIISCLQEVGSNADTHSQTQPGECPQLAKSEHDCDLLDGKIMKKFYEERLDPCLNMGNKDNQYPRESRLIDFCHWCFANVKPVIIASGHSGWMRSFFDTFLPPSETLDGCPLQMARVFKQENCCVTAFNLEWDPNAPRTEAKTEGYSINPKSVRLLYGEFRVPKKDLDRVREQQGKGNLLPRQGNLSCIGPGSKEE